jgi:hypothetical protein
MESTRQCPLPGSFLWLRCVRSATDEVLPASSTLLSKYREWWNGYQDVKPTRRDFPFIGGFWNSRNDRKDRRKTVEPFASIPGTDLKPRTISLILSPEHMLSVLPAHQASPHRSALPAEYGPESRLLASHALLPCSSTTCLFQANR